MSQVETTPKKLSNTERKAQRVEKFNQETATNYERLLTASAASTLENLTLNKAIKTYLEVGAKYLTPKQIEVLTFANIVAAIKENKTLCDKTYFSFHQITLVCSSLLKVNDKNIARSIKAAAQNKKAAKQL